MIDFEHEMTENLETMLRASVKIAQLERLVKDQHDEITLLKALLKSSQAKLAGYRGQN